MTKSYKVMSGKYQHTGGEQRGYCLGYAHALVSFYPCPPVKVVCEQTGEVIFSHDGNGKVNVNSTIKDQDD